jgi:hypothetical protein
MTKRAKYIFYSVAVIALLLLCILLSGISVQREHYSKPSYSKLSVRIGTSYTTWLNVSVFNGEMSGSGIDLRVLVQKNGTLTAYKHLILYFANGKWESSLTTEEWFIDNFELSPP